MIGNEFIAGIFIMYARTITKEQINQLPAKSFEGRIWIIDDYHECKRMIPVIQEEHIWGFDTETKPSFKKGELNRPALLQLANSFHAFLFRLNRIGIPDELLQIIENGNIRKVGVASHDDLKDLKLIRKCNPEGFLELQSLVGEYGIENKGLREIAAIVLKFRISKFQQLTNWENQKLTYPQKKYAATDAWACYEIYKELMNNGL